MSRKYLIQVIHSTKIRIEQKLRSHFFEVSFIK